MAVSNNNKLPFIGMELIKIGKHLKTRVYRKTKQQIRAFFSTIKVMLMPATNDPF